MSIENLKKNKKIAKSIYISDEIQKIVEITLSFLPILGGLSWFVALLILACLPKIDIKS